MSTLYFCSRCKQEHETVTEEIASYICPMSSKQKEKVKVLDSERFRLLTAKLRTWNNRSPNNLNLKD